MLKHDCTQERFESDVATHRMCIPLDVGEYRHLKFKRPDSNQYWFDITTWPGFLCISGDMGTYVFSRVLDMFEFFRCRRGETINPGYWGEKLQAIAGNEGYREFDETAFEERVTNHFNTYWEDTDNIDARNECWSEIQEAILLRQFDNEWEAYNAVHDFEFRYECDRIGGKVFTFQDFFDGGGTDRYTYHYIWALRAIVWAIQQYDGVKSDGIRA